MPKYAPGTPIKFLNQHCQLADATIVKAGAKDHLYVLRDRKGHLINVHNGRVHPATIDVQAFAAAVAAQIDRQIQENFLKREIIIKMAVAKQWSGVTLRKSLRTRGEAYIKDIRHENDTEICSFLFIPKGHNFYISFNSNCGDVNEGDQEKIARAEAGDSKVGFPINDIDKLRQQWISKGYERL